MSMHEVESLVELSVYALDNSQEEPLDRRSLFYNLYLLQNQFDTGFTHFRVMDILIKYHFVYPLPITAHPAYTQYSAHFDALAASKKFSFIYVNPIQEWDAESNPVAGYANFDHTTQQYILYADAGSTLWAGLVENGTLQGEDAVAPEHINVFNMAHEIAEIAGQQKDKGLLGLWYQLLPYIVMNTEQAGEPVHYKPLEAILDLVTANDAIEEAVLPPSDELPEGGELGKFCTWWYAPAADKMKTAAEMSAEEEKLDLEAVPFSEKVEKSAAWYEQQVANLLQEINHAITYLEENGPNEDIQKSVEGRLQLGIEYADKGLELAPNEPALLVNKGSLLMLLEKYPEALVCYDAALAIAPTNAYVHLNRAILYYHMNQIPAAIASFEQLLTLEPDNEFAQQWLAHLKNGGQ
ncbi:tetratricopeptide repeat protein [Chitinophaga nivalis]|uniref:Tetratricopeptide repeat protein n=1 Tax=Chitinophaga nivalis TaxID=2991709 RepID=A0ABT3IG88_9BACT|nr:tetratricopeptide repeat protein [Chitinophaga nivalis]MCW3467338.1 tetratricopeptide repeat protein [Chitinophaga nivalis]MCW3482970.1 tetratricopeptide repeat protein [Chitinophaga nivalis]